MDAPSDTLLMKETMFAHMDFGHMPMLEWEDIPALLMGDHADILQFEDQSDRTDDSIGNADSYSGIEVNASKSYEEETETSTHSSESTDYEKSTKRKRDVQIRDICHAPKEMRQPSARQALLKKQEPKESASDLKFKKLSTSNISEAPPPARTSYTSNLEIGWELIEDSEEGSWKGIKLLDTVYFVWEGLEKVIHVLQMSQEIVKAIPSMNDKENLTKCKNLLEAFSRTKKFRAYFELAKAKPKCQELRTELASPFFERDNWKFRLICPRRKGDRNMRRVGVLVDSKNLRSITIRKPMLDVLLQERAYCEVLLCGMRKAARCTDNDSTRRVTLASVLQKTPQFFQEDLNEKNPEIPHKKRKRA